MAAKAQWLLQLPAILEEIRALACPFLDRAAVQKLFGLKRRQAISLLGSWANYRSGQSFLADRLQVIARLEAILNGQAFQEESLRRARLDHELEEARKIARGRKIQIPSLPDVRDRVLSDLPAAIHLQPGELRIEFFGTEDLLRHLFELSQAILNDYQKFQRTVEHPDV